MGFISANSIYRMFGQYGVSGYLRSVIINKYKGGVEFNIHLVSYISVWYGILAFIPPYVRVVADFVSVRPFTDLIWDKRQRSQIFSFLCFKDAPSAAGAFLKGLLVKLL